MATKLKKFKTQEEIPEALRDFYEERNGEWVPAAEGEDTTALRNAYDRVKAAEKELRKKYGNLPDDITGEQILALLDEKKNRDDEDARKAGDFEKLKTQLIEQHNKALDKATTRAANLESAIHKLVIDNEVMSILSNKDLGIKSATLLKPHITAKLRVVEDQNMTFRIEVLNDKGEPRIGDTQGAPFTVKNLVEELRGNADFASAFNAPSSSGSGAGDGKSTSQLPGSGAVRSIRDLRTDADKVAFIQENGREAFENLLLAGAQETAASK